MGLRRHQDVETGGKISTSMAHAAVLVAQKFLVLRPLIRFQMQGGVMKKNHLLHFALALCMAIFHFGAISQPVTISVQLQPLERTFAGKYGSDVSANNSLSAISAQVRSQPRPLFIGPPLIQTKGIVKGVDVLYVADTGKDATHSEPATIWRIDPKTRQVSIFYRGPLLVNAKWLYFLPAEKGRGAELIVSDYGVEVSPRTPGTGEGAKVFSIPVDANGNPGPPRVLYQGTPLRSPEGVTVVGDSAILADWAAGPETSLANRPGTFNRGRIFSIPLAGGPPEVLFPDQIFVTLIAACRYEGEDGNTYIRFIDIDGSRPHREGAYLPQSGLVAFYRTRILSERPLVLGTLERSPIRERIEIEITIPPTVERDSAIELELHDGALFPDGSRVRGLSGLIIATGEPLKLVLESDTDDANVRITMRKIIKGQVVWTALIDKPKSFPPYQLMDNKHGGRKAPFSTGPRLMATADGTSRTLSLIPANGGSPVTLWKGDPFVQPMGVQYSWDGKVLWVTDQAAGPQETGAVFEIELPSEDTRRAMFREMKFQRPLKALPTQ